MSRGSVTEKRLKATALDGKISGDIVLTSSLCKTIRFAKILYNQIQWSLPKRTLREADNPSTTDKPCGTELTCHEYNNS